MYLTEREEELQISHQIYLALEALYAVCNHYTSYNIKETITIRPFAWKITGN